VRLIHRQLAERALIKGYSGLVVDIAFAFTDLEILGSLDETGTLHVHRIDLDKESRRIVYPCQPFTPRPPPPPLQHPSPQPPWLDCKISLGFSGRIMSPITAPQVSSCTFLNRFEPKSMCYFQIGKTADR